MNNIFIIIIGKSGIIESRKHDAEDDVMFSLGFKVTPEMLPSSNLIVYYIQPSGEVVFNQLKLEFDDLLGNYVSVFSNILDGLNILLARKF